MKTIENNLSTDEKIVYRSVINPTEYTSTIIFALLTPFCYSITMQFGTVMLILTIGSFLYSLLTIKNTEFVITNKKVIQKKGIISADIEEILLNKVEGIKVKQDVIDRIFKSGTVIISGSGGSKTNYKNMVKPFEFRKQLADITGK